MRTPFHSIRWRVQAWHGAILLVVVAAFCVTTYRLSWNNHLRRIDKDVHRLDWSLIRALSRVSRPAGAPQAVGGDESPPSPTLIAARLRGGTVALPAETAALFEGTDPGFAYFILRDGSGKVLLQSPNAAGALDTPCAQSRDIDEEFRMIGHHREKVHRGGQTLNSVVGRDITPELDEMHRLAISLAVSGFAVWGLGLLGGWWIAGRAIQPIKTISRTASRIAAGNLDKRISTAGTDSELDQLSHVLNETFARLHTAFETQKQFTADASHELRTPVTILLSETHRMLKRERTPEEYRQALQTCHDTAQRMRQLIEALLLLANQEARRAGSPCGRCDLAAILKDTVQQLAPLAAARSIAVDTDLKEAACQGDPASLSVLASNLVANAIHHNRDGGWVHLTCRQDGPSVAFTVRDNGPGIAAEDLPHIFQRFYRGDKARTPTSGRTGLGLAIARTIAENHGGSISVDSKPGAGACFTVRLPSTA